MTLPRGQIAIEVRPQIKQGLTGDWQINSPRNEWLTALNVSPQANDVWTFTVNAATSSHDYTVTANGVSVVYTSDSSATIDEIVAGLANAIAAEPASGSTVAYSLSANTITCTSQWPGMANTFAESEGDLSLVHTTTGATGEAIPFGVVVCSDGYSTDGSVKKCYLPKSTNFTAQVATVDYIYQASTVIVVEVYDEMTGALIASASHIMAANKDTTTTALAGILNAQAPANSVIFANAGATGYELTCTAEKAGLEFRVAVDAGASAAPSVTATTGPSVATSLLRAFLGISMRDGSVVPTNLTDLTSEYPGNYPCTIASKGWLWVTNSQAPAFRDVVYVEMDGTSAACGQLYNTSTSTRLAISKYAKWERSALSSSGDALAGLYLNATGL